jgi:hypothetical protein
MHPQLVPGRLPQGASLLNPGLLEKAQDASFWKPEGLPLSPKEAGRYVQEALDFGERFKNPKDLAHLGAAPQDDFYSESGLSLKSELGQAVFSGPGGPEGRSAKPALQGQMTLLLARVLEERVLELKGLGEAVREGWNGLRSSLGLEDEQERVLPSARLDDLFAADSGAFTAWPGLLPWFLLFLPRQGQLLVSHHEIKTEWEEWGIEWTELPPGSRMGELSSDELPGRRLLTARAPGWQLCLAKRPDPERPWLDQEFTVAFAEGLP